MLNTFTPATDWTVKPDPPSAAQKVLSQAILEADWNAGPFPWMTNLLMQVAPGGRYVSDPFVTITGPNALPTPYWTRRDNAAPSVPTSVNWDATENTITPKTAIVSCNVDTETLLKFRAFTQIVDGTGATLDGPAADPTLVWTMARALTVETGRVIATSSNTTTDPVHAIATYAGIRTGTAVAPAFSVLQDAYSDLQADRRWNPSAAFVSPRAYVELRKERDAAGNLLHRPADPLVLDTQLHADGTTRQVPIVPVAGFPEGFNSVAIVADWKNVIALHREVSEGLLLRVDASDHTNFNTDKRALRLMRRYDFGIIAGAEQWVSVIQWHTNPT